MDNVGNSESVSNEDTAKSMQSWPEIVSAIQEEGLRMANQLREQGEPFDVGILAPREVKGGDTIPLSGVVLPLDWKIAKRREMVESARDLITNAYILDSLDPMLPTALRSVIEGKGLYKYSVGELFELYGQFQGKHQLKTDKQTKAKMSVLINGDRKYLKPIKARNNRNKVELHPLPYAVRNIFAHSGTNTNRVDQNGEELKTSIELLRSWVHPKK